jgi:hypothetical protein
MRENKRYSEPGTNATGDTAGEGRHERCVVCGEPIDTTGWYPIRGRQDDDGIFRVYAFCSEACREAWENSNSADTD